MGEPIIAIANQIRSDRYKDAEVVLAAGSIVRGEGTAFSDLDLVVVYAELPCAYRESFRVGGYPVEAFVHDPATLEYFFLDVDRPSGIPSLPQMVVEGIEIPEPTALSRQLKQRAAAVIEAGPPVLDAEAERRMRYFVCDVLDDLRAPRSRDELVGAGARLYQCLADYHLRRLGRWSAKGKAIPRVLRQTDAGLGAAYCDAFAALFAEGDAAAVVRLAEGLLSEAGGPLYKAEAPVAWRRKPAASTGGRTARPNAAEGTTADPTPNIRYSDTGFTADEFLVLAQRVWPGGYDVPGATSALTRTTNIGAWDGERLVGAVRVLTDGYFFATVPEILVDPDYQRRGIGRELMRRALAAAPRRALFFGAQPESVGFFERLGCEQGPAGMVMRQTPARQPGA